MIQTMQICTNHFEIIMMNKAINLLSVIPMRKEPSHKSEMVSQLLFGECTEILEEEGHFVKVRCLYDNYEGWIQANQLCICDEELTTNEFTFAYACEVLHNGQTVRIPFGSPIYGRHKNPVTIAGNEIKYFLGKVKASEFSGIYSHDLSLQFEALKNVRDLSLFKIKLIKINTGRLYPLLFENNIEFFFAIVFHVGGTSDESLCMFSLQTFK